MTATLDQHEDLRVLELEFTITYSREFGEYVMLVQGRCPRSDEDIVYLTPHLIPVSKTSFMHRSGPSPSPTRVLEVLEVYILDWFDRPFRDMVKVIDRSEEHTELPATLPSLGFPVAQIDDRTFLVREQS